MTAPLAPESEELLEIARSGRPRPAIGFAQDLVRSGLPFDRLVADHLVPVQREVGRLWQENRWTVADEHAASAVIDGVVGALALDLSEPDVPIGHVLVACVEEEYHSLPARLGTELLRHAGWAVTFLGASVPAQDLQTYAVETGPDVVVLSCTFAEHLYGARRCVAAVGDLGLPAVVAGAATAAGPRLVDWLGASAAIVSGADASEVLSRPLAPAQRREERVPSALALELDASEMAEACMSRLFPTIGQMGRYTPQQLASTRSDVDHLLRHLVLAVDVAEPALFDDLVRWLQLTLTARRVPASVLPDSLAVLAEVLRRAGHEAAAAVCAGAT